MRKNLGSTFQKPPDSGIEKAYLCEGGWEFCLSQAGCTGVTGAGVGGFPELPFLLGVDDGVFESRPETY